MTASPPTPGRFGRWSVAYGAILFLATGVLQLVGVVLNAVDLLGPGRVGAKGDHVLLIVTGSISGACCLIMGITFAVIRRRARARIRDAAAVKDASPNGSADRH